MPQANDVRNDAVLAKCLALITKTRDRVRQVDKTDFPTARSEDARQLILAALEALVDPKHLAAMDPQVLYNKLIRMQELVDDVESSASRDISWPLVSYWSDVWNDFFGDTGPSVFFASIPEHNYKISTYSARLRLLLTGLLSSGVITNLLGNRKLYCLHLASLEHTNLPMYANIAHEFGHALHDTCEMEIHARWANSFSPVIQSMLLDFVSADRDAAVRRILRTAHVLRRFAEECFADLIGARLAGPAFLLSLDEIAWGQDRDTWIVKLVPNDQQIRAYPSFNFRLSSIKQVIDIVEFIRDTKREFKSLDTDKLKATPDYLSAVEIDDSRDTVSAPVIDQDRDVIKEILSRHLDAVKDAIKSFIDGCQSFIDTKYGAQPQLDIRDIAALVHRLENDILPNIVPDNTLLGRPAAFPEILNAAAIFRLHLLMHAGPGSEAVLAEDVSKVERLTEKALEVSYVQRRYKANFIEV